LGAFNLSLSRAGLGNDLVLRVAESETSIVLQTEGFVESTKQSVFSASCDTVSVEDRSSLGVSEEVESVAALLNLVLAASPFDPWSTGSPDTVVSSEVLLEDLSSNVNSANLHSVPISHFNDS